MQTIIRSVVAWMSIGLLPVTQAAFADEAGCRYGNLSDCSAPQVRDLLRDALVHYDSTQVKVLKNVLVVRQTVPEAVSLLQEDAGVAGQYWALEILEELRSAETDALVRPIANGELTVTAYNANLYFAEVGDVTALGHLNDNYGQYPVPAYSWAPTMALFGQYQFKPATQHLLTSIVSGNLSIADAAIAALVKMYAPPQQDIDQFGSYPEIQKYFQALLARQSP